MSKQIIAFAPGKMYISGEYAVVHSGHPAIIMSIDQGVFVTISASDTYEIASNKYHGEWHKFSINNHYQMIVDASYDFTYTIYAVETLLQYAMPLVIKPFRIKVKSQLDDAYHQKYGFGSSAAVLVATIMALSDYFSLALSKDHVFKLAVMAQIRQSSASSFGDIACSVYQGTIYYIKGEIDIKQPLSKIIDTPWHGFVIEQLPSIPCLVLVGYSQVSANSIQMVTQVNQYYSHPQFQVFLYQAAHVVNQTKKAIQQMDCQSFTKAIEDYRQLLLTLQQLTKVAIEIPNIELMISLANQAHAVAKTSGAGGGDCVIVFALSFDIINQCQRLWEDHHIEVVNHVKPI